MEQLYANNWVLDFSGGHFWSDPTDELLMQIKFFLTDEGLQNSIEIIKLLFEHINSIEYLIKKDPDDIKKLHK